MTLPAGHPLPADAYVFGNEIGQQVKSSKRAWEAAVLKAHGHTPAYPVTANLTAESRAALAAIDLHFPDLRREAGSRWLEGGVPLHTIRAWLGHTNIAQTSTYLAGTIQTEHNAMRHFEERRATLAQLGTDSRTGGRKRLQTVVRRERKPKKTAVGRTTAPRPGASPVRRGTFTTDCEGRSRPSAIAWSSAVRESIVVRSQDPLLLTAPPSGHGHVSPR